MARRVSVGELQQMQRGELDAERTITASGGAGLDPLSGQISSNGKGPGFQSPARSVAEQLQALVLEDDIAGMPLGQIDGLLRRAVEAAHVNATAAEITAEAERRYAVMLDDVTGFDDAPVEPKPEDRADVPASIAAVDVPGFVGDPGPLARALTVDVNPDGTVAEVRPSEMTPDRGEGVGETHHTITDDDEPRFSGGGASDDDLPFGGTEPSRLIPMDGAFLNERHKEAPELANLAEKLIDEHGFFEQLRHCRIDYKWRRKGTNSAGKRAIGKLERVSGIWSAYVPYSFVVWLAADTARLARFTDRQVEAALFHQLAHIAKDAKGNWIRIGHDFEGFGSEVRHYGPWTEDLKIGSDAFTVAVQLGLDLDADDEEDDEDDAQGVDPYEEAVYGEPPDTSGELPTGDEIDAARAASGFAASAEGGKEDTDILFDDPV